MTIATPATSDVKAVIQIPDDVTDANITIFINQAALIAGRCPSLVEADAATQAAAVMWLTAHLLSIRYGRSGQLSSRSLGDASETYVSGAMPLGTGLASTFYGQQALVLDPSGCLAKLGKPRPIFESM